MSTPAASGLRPGARRRRVRLAVALVLGLVLWAGEAWFSAWTLGPLLALVLALADGSAFSGAWDRSSAGITAACFGGWLFGATTRTLLVLLPLHDVPLRRVLPVSCGVGFTLLVALLVAARLWGPF